MTKPGADTVNSRQAARVIDAHVHCFAERGDPRYPYHPRGPYQPERAAPPGDLLACLAAAGVDDAVLVQPEPYQDDHRYLEACLDLGRGSFKATCLFFADRPGALDDLTGLVRRRAGQVVAARIHAYAPDRLPPFGTPELRAYWARAGELGLAIQLHFEPRYAPGFESLIREFPAVPVIVDHLGRPFQGTPEEYAVVLGWARLPNVAVKLSLLSRRDEYPHRDVGPIVDALIAAFGPGRLLAGSNFGAGTTPAAYLEDWERIASYLDDLSAEDRAQVLGGTAARLFGFDAA